MFKIGEFSRLSGTPAKTLRYYDEIGLLKPAKIDRFTGYRYYTADQLSRLHRILALKDLGLSLEQIARLLDENLSKEQIVGMLRLREAELREAVKDQQAKLSHIQARLNQIEQEGKMPQYDITIKQVKPQTILSVREVVNDLEGMPAFFAKWYKVMYSFANQHNLKPGVASAIYHDGDAYREEAIDSEAAVPLEVAPNGVVLPEGVTVRELAASDTVASVIHHGSYDTILNAYAAINEWIQKNGYQIVGAVREIYLRGPETGEDTSQYVTEINYTVTRV
jgi:DNA-binding transcriptional MerR regulator